MCHQVYFRTEFSLVSICFPLSIMEREMWQQSSTPDPVNLSYRISSLEYPIHNSSNYTSSAFSTSFLRQNDLYQQQYNCIFLCMVLLLPTLCYSGNYVSRAAYYSTPDGMGIPSMPLFTFQKNCQFYLNI